jgi:hypothetical protein
MASNEAGKGDKRRPTNYNVFSNNYDLIFKKKPNEQKTDRAVNPTQEGRQEQLPRTSQTAHD